MVTKSVWVRRKGGDGRKVWREKTMSDGTGRAVVAASGSLCAPESSTRVNTAIERYRANCKCWYEGLSGVLCCPARCSPVSSCRGGSCVGRRAFLQCCVRRAVTAAVGRMDNALPLLLRAVLYLKRRRVASMHRDARISRPSGLSPVVSLQWAGRGLSCRGPARHLVLVVSRCSAVSPLGGSCSRCVCCASQPRRDLGGQYSRENWLNELLG